METILSVLGEHWAAIGAILAVFIDISPIKFNPIKWLFGKIGDMTVGNRIDELAKTVDENEMDRIRSTVLSFAASCRQNVEHTRDEYQHIINLNGKYEKLLKKYDMANGVFTEEYKYILSKYNKEN